MSALRIALAEYDIGWHDPDAALAGARAIVEQAGGSGAQVVVLPEMATTGFTMDAAQAVSLAAPTVDRLRAIARDAGLWLIAGVALRDSSAAGDCVVNAALAIDPGGAIAAVHRKRRMFAFAGEHETYAAGRDATIVTIDGVRIALFICYELRFAELFAPVATSCDAMIVIANWPAARRPHWDALLRARAIENQCVVIGVNRTGTANGVAYDGGSAAFDAWGEPMPMVDRVVAVDPAAVSRTRERYPFLRDRQIGER